MVVIGVLALFILGLFGGLFLLLRVLQEHLKQVTELLSNAVNRTTAAASEAITSAAYGGSAEVEQPPANEAETLTRPAWEQWGEDDGQEPRDPTDRLLPDEPQFDNATRVALVEPGYTFRPPPDLGGEAYPDEPV